MSYEKQEFKANTVLHASQLNAMDSQLSEADGMMDNVALQITAMNEKINKQNLEKIDGAYVENGYLFLTSNGEVVVGNLGPFSGESGTGGHSVNEARLTVKNVSGWLSKTIAESQDCIIAIDWSSTEDGLSTGNGVIKIVNNGVTKATYDITQGSISVDLAKYLSAGSNSVKVTISDAYSNSRTINFSITVVSVSLTSTFDDSMVYDGDINFVCTPIGNINKTLHFSIDSKEISSFETTSSNRQLSFKIAKLQNGSHVLTVYFKGSSINISGWNTSNVTSMDDFCAFVECTVNGINDLNTDSVTSFRDMFYNANIPNLDISGYNFSNATKINGMFEYYKGTVVSGLDAIDTSNVTSMYALFANSYINSVDVSNWNTSNVEDIRSMFSSFKGSEIIGLNNMNVSKVTSLDSVFRMCRVANLDVHSWNTGNVEDMGDTFYNVGWPYDKGVKTNINISGWNMSKVTDISGFMDLTDYYTESVALPATNGNGISNTKSRIYGSSESVYYDLTGHVSESKVTIAS